MLVKGSYEPPKVMSNLEGGVQDLWIPSDGSGSNQVGRSTGF